MLNYISCHIFYTICQVTFKTVLKVHIYVNVVNHCYMAYSLNMVHSGKQYSISLWGYTAYSSCY